MFSCARIVRVLQVLFVTLALGTMVAAQSNSLFTTLSLNPVGSGPVAIASGDFNGDGFPDRAVVNYASNSVSILLGTGDGNFQPAVNYTVGEYPTAIVAGDFNRDGHLDLAVVNYGDPGRGGTVLILLGRGDGTFATGATYSLFGPEALVAGDLDGDGNLDLAVVIDDYNGHLSINLLHGNGDGSFQTGANLGAGSGIGIGSIAIGDFTGDGKPDLAVFFVAGGTGYLATYVNDGSGGFKGELGCTLGAQGRVSLAVGDFNNDGKLDVAVAIGSGNSIAICLGNGDGTFSLASSPAVGTNPIGLAAGDLNGDGKIDLVANNYTDGTVSVLLGKGDGTFTNSATYPVGKQPVDLALADLNGDGKLDVTVVNGADNNVQALLGRGDGTFFVGTYRMGASPSSITSGDFNRDGIPDLAVANGDASITILLGDGHGGFKVLNSFPGCSIHGDPIVPGKILAADLNGDGTDDLAIICNDTLEQDGSLVNLFQGNGNGTFMDAIDLGIGSAPLDMVAADVDGDGIPDLVVSTTDFSFAYSLNLNHVYSVYSGASLGVEAGDFNADGKTDLLINGLGVALLGEGAGNFEAFVTGQAGGLTGDFNGDGLTDFESNTDQQMQVSLSNGDGTFSNGFLLSSNKLGALQAPADFNGDGILDLLSLTGLNAPLTVFFGKDDGSFVDSGVSLLPPGGYYLTAIADFDRNGSPDIAILNPTAGIVSIALNKNSFQLTNTALSESPGKVVAGGPLTLSAAVSAKQGTPTGNLEFKQSGVPQTTVPLSSGLAQATLTAPPLAGTYGFTALYTGDGTFSGSLSQRLLVTVSAASTTTTVTSNAPLSKLGQSVTFTATVHPQYSGQPTGTVEFYADGNPMGSVSVSGGQAAFSTSSLTLGAHTIQADYSGDSSFTTSLGGTKQKVGDAASSIQLTSSLNPAGYGQPVTLRATVTDSAGSTPTGVVVFAERGAYYGTVTLSGGVAQIALPTTLAAGKHTITAQYSGDSTDGAAKASLTQVITGASSTTTITSDTEPSIYGQTVTFTAVVSSTAGTPDGTVTFKNGSAVLGTVALSGGQATYAISTLNGGTHTIKAVYNGSSGYGPSSASVFQVVEPAATTTTLTSSLNPAPFGQTVTFTAVVASTASATPTGTVTIKDGKKVLGSASLVNGQMQISTSLLSEGGHTLTATYAGSADFSGSSGTLSQVMQ
jgi:Bacterial Ig-like domain (group 3)/FG-GAP-like repeat